MVPSPSWNTPSSTYDPTCFPKRYSPCPSQLLDMQVGAGRPAMSPNAVVVLVFSLTVVLWILCFFGFLWWMKTDVVKIKEAIEGAGSSPDGRGGGGGNGDGGNGDRNDKK
jgi:hypothetical protein